MTDKQSEALRLADLLVKATVDKDLFTTALGFDAANELSVLDYKAKEQTAELRRLHSLNAELLSTLNAMLTHMGMDEDEWNKPTFDQARAAIARAEGKQ